MEISWNTIYSVLRGSSVHSLKSGFLQDSLFPLIVSLIRRPLTQHLFVHLNFSVLNDGCGPSFHLTVVLLLKLSGHRRVVIFILNALNFCRLVDSRILLLFKGLALSVSLSKCLLLLLDPILLKDSLDGGLLRR